MAVGRVSPSTRVSFCTLLVLSTAPALTAASVVAAAATAASGRRALNLGKQPGAGAGAAAGEIVKPLEFSHHLRVCDAYPSSMGVDVYINGHQKLTCEQPMAYGMCRDFTVRLAPGDVLEFQAGDTFGGMFSLSEVPLGDAVLLLVFHRHDAQSNTMAFQSHIFTRSEHPQVAVIDAFEGPCMDLVHIKDKMLHAGHALCEDLRFDSVVSVNQGHYEVELVSSTGVAANRHDIVALNHESYAVVRVGVGAKDGNAYPKDLIVFPRSDPKMLPPCLGGDGASATPTALFARISDFAAKLRW